MKTIVCVIGTGPEAIKMAPLVLALQQAPWARCRVVLTGQHRELVSSVLAAQCIDHDLDLNVMRLSLPLDRLANHLVQQLWACSSGSAEIVLAQGDTTSVLATALASSS